MAKREKWTKQIILAFWKVIESFLTSLRRNVWFTLCSQKIPPYALKSHSSYIYLYSSKKISSTDLPVSVSDSSSLICCFAIQEQHFCNFGCLAWLCFHLSIVQTLELIWCSSTYLPWISLLCHSLWLTLITICLILSEHVFSCQFIDVGHLDGSKSDMPYVECERSWSSSFYIATQLFSKISGRGDWQRGSRQR